MSRAFSLGLLVGIVLMMGMVVGDVGPRMFGRVPSGPGSHAFGTQPASLSSPIGADPSREEMR